MPMDMTSLREKANKEWLKVTNPHTPQIFIGMATCGEAAGAMSVYKAIESALRNKGIDAQIHKTGCLGMCYCEPVIDIIKPGEPRISYKKIDADTASELIDDYLIHNNPRPDMALGVWGEEKYGIPDIFELPSRKSQRRIALRNAGVIDPENIMHYIAMGGYNGLSRALNSTPEDVIKEVEEAGLRGRGGAGFPTALKWRLCRDAKESIKYLVCNADEGDPGAFMDRALLDSDPHSVLEGMLIGGYAVGSNHGFIYVRAEYPMAIKRLKTAIGSMRDVGLLGNNILGTNFNFDIEIREGAGAFVCGEETALIASIEGNRGIPHPRPPFPAEYGLWGKPTVINNVETWANIPVILEKGASWFKQYGTDKSRGTKTLALAGKINHTGLIEVPMGITLRQIIYDIGGGIPNGKRFKAVQIGGPSGGCLPEGLLDIPVDFNSLSAAGAMMGSGGMVVMDEDACMVDVARYFLDFTCRESCGQCFPCRLGTKQMFDILNSIASGQGKPGDIETLLELSESIKNTSLCGLGHSAPNPVITTIRYFRDEYEAHIKDKRCPAGVCKALINGEQPYE
jgi:NADH:ubiquinone oxidoreductase subunit F (NADH-binding)/(2Fe-2S) ferredoxin